MSEISYTVQDRVALIGLHAASKGNAFTPEMRRALNEALVRYRDDDDAWVAVIHADGADFCVGTADAPARTRKEARERAALWGGGYVETWKATIAAVQGRCVGEGMALALSCNLRAADETATFDTDYASASRGPDTLAVWLTALVGTSAALDLLWARKTVSARHAHGLGLVNQLVVKGEPKPDISAGDGRLPMQPRDRILPTREGTALSGALLLAREVLMYAPVTRTFQGETLYRSVGVPYVYAQNLEVGRNPYASEDRIEGTRAFVERRRPAWRNR